METLLKEAEEMQLFLEMEPATEANEMIERLSQLNVYMARSGKLLSDAGYLRDRALMRFSNLKELIPLAASVQKTILEAACAEENKLVKWLDRINRACVHQSENLRTQISFSKEQLSLERRGY